MTALAGLYEVGVVEMLEANLDPYETRLVCQSSAGWVHRQALGQASRHVCAS